MGLPGLYPHTVAIEAVSSRDAYGAGSHATVATPRALVVPQSKLMRRANGEEIVSRGRAILEGPVAGLTDDCVITFPSTFSALGYGSRMRILDAVPYTDPLTGAVDNVEVFV